MKSEQQNIKPEQAPEEIRIIEGKKYRKVDNGYTIRQYFSHEGPGWDTRYSMLSQYGVDDSSELPDELYYSWELLEDDKKIVEEKIIGPNPKSIEEAKEYIKGMQSLIRGKANNDTEDDQIKTIVHELEAGILSPI